MSDKEPTGDKSPSPSTRRISKPRGRNFPNKKTPAAATDAGQKVRPITPHGAGDLPAAVPATPASDPKPPATAAPDAPLTSQSDWPEPEAPTSGGPPAPDGKRKRRRRKGKGPAASAQAAITPEEIHASHEPAELPPPDSPKLPRVPPHPSRQPASRSRIDPEILSRKAWKIFLAEVSEEGIALIGDQDARELARRCFRLAEIFIEEQARRIPGGA